MATSTFPRRPDPDDHGQSEQTPPDGREPLRRRVPTTKVTPRQQATDPGDPDGDAEMTIDTSKMSAGQAAALSVAEAAREQHWRSPSFGKQLFMGRFASEMFAPFPEQGPEDAAVGDALLDQLDKLLRERLDPAEVDASRSIPAELVEGLASLGIFAMKVPKEYGGLGLSQVNYNRAMMLIASYCASTAVLVSAHQSIGVPQPLKLFGTEAQKRRYFPRFRDGAISAFALTEPGVGSDPAQMQTHAELSADGSHYVLSGEKLWCTNGPIADILVVMAKTPPKIVRGKERQQITAFIVEADWPGVEVVHRCDFLGIRGIQNGLLRFHEVAVPVENVLWGEGKGLKLALTTLNTGRLTLPAACTGAAKQCLNIARRWAKERVQWGAAIGEHEAGATKLADIAATTFAMEAVTWLTSHWADRGDVDIRIEAAMAKLFCSEAGWRLVDTTLQLRGGRGYEREASLAARGETPFPIERMLRDMRINRIIEGTTDIMHLFLAREALDGHLQRAGKILHPKTPLLEKLGTAVKAGAWYAWWYPTRWVAPALLHPHGGMGPLARHYRFLERCSKRLSRALFHAMLRHGPSLEKRQRLLARLMEIGSECFAMAATCSYARSVWARRDGDHGAIELADTFCQQARLRIKEHFRTLRANCDRSDRRLAARVLGDGLRWLEDGIMVTPGEEPA